MDRVNGTLATEADLQLWHTSRGLSPVYDDEVHPLPQEPDQIRDPASAATPATIVKSKRRPAAEKPGEGEEPALNDAGQQPQTNPPGTPQETVTQATDM